MNYEGTQTCRWCRNWARLVILRRKNRDPATEAFEQGVSFVGKGNLDAGIAAFTDAIRLNPQFAEAYYNRGYALDQKRECDKAIADYTDAVRLNPKFVLAYYNRGSDFDMKGDYDKAIADYTEAIRIKPQYANAYDAAGLSLGKSANMRRRLLISRRKSDLSQAHRSVFQPRPCLQGKR